MKKHPKRVAITLGSIVALNLALLILFSNQFGPEAISTGISRIRDSIKLLFENTDAAEGAFTLEEFLSDPPQYSEEAFIVLNNDVPLFTPQEKKRIQGVSYTVDGSFVYQVPCGSIVIGREHGMRECLSEKSFVSRVHAKLTVEDGILFIENLSSTNYTYVNNRRIGHGKVQLHEGDEIGLGGICINGNRQDEAAYLVVGIMP